VKIPKPTTASLALFEGLVPSSEPGVEVKPMFGNVAAFVNGNMFMGVFGGDVGVKLPASDVDSLKRLGGGPFGPAERPMGGYVSLPAGYTQSQAEPWVRKALTYVGAQPPKAKKKAK